MRRRRPQGLGPCAAAALACLLPALLWGGAAGAFRCPGRGAGGPTAAPPRGARVPARGSGPAEWTRREGPAAAGWAVGLRGLLAGLALAAVSAASAVAPAAAEEALAGGPQRRVVSVGDLHGDFAQTRLILRELGLMGEKGEWTGGDSVLVQTGDVVDRGDESGPIFEALFRLQDQAPAAGGEVILLLGNHELMNLEGDFRYATPGDTRSLGVSVGDRGRAFGPDGWVGARLRERGRAVALVGPERGLQRSVLFVHAGVLPEIAEAAGRRAGVDEPSGRRLEETLNRALGKAISGDADSIRFSRSALLSPDGPFWTRRLALDSQQGARGACADLQRSLDAFGAARMVVGHTAQADGRVHHRCGGQLILGDTLISAAYTGTPHPSAVEYLPDGSAFALYPGTGGRSALPTPPARPGAAGA